MRKPLLALMRGKDGRSLARALAALLLINLFAAGFHTGAQAFTAGTGAGAICSMAAAGTSTDGPAPADHRPPCCTIGCLSAVATLPPAEAPAAFPLAAAGAPHFAFATAAPATPFFPAHPPRGPPSFA